MEIHQLLAGFRTGDAISNYVLELNSIFQEMGYKSNIYVVPEHVCTDLKKIGISYLKHKEVSSPENILIYHFSLGSKASDYFLKASDKKFLIYHNITPAKFFRLLDSQAAKVLDHGREELKELASVTESAIGVSEYNRRELQEAGFAKTAVLPLAISQNYLNTKPSKKILQKHNKKIKKIITVGRIAPNKKIEDIIKTFYFYKKTINPHSQLILIGGYEGTEKYHTYLKTLLMELDLKDVLFSKHIPLNELIAHYYTADAFLSMSEHEGFCLPLLEAMHFGLPVFAFNSSAISETLNNSGILILKKDFKTIAELIDKILDNEERKTKLIARQKQRVEEFNQHDLKQKLKNILDF